MNSAVFVDARHLADYKAEHVKGARSLYVANLDKNLPKVLGNLPRDKAIVTYGSDPKCEAEIKLADELAARGFRRVFILHEGLPAWKKAGYPTD